MAQRYNRVAIALHWLIAAGLLANLGLGLWMSWAIDSPTAQARAVSVFQIHKSLGLAVLVLSLLRLAWRLLHPQPLYPAGMKQWEKFLASATHWLFYVLMIGLPLSGWLYVSAQWRGDGPFTIPTLWFGLFEVPHLFGLNDADRALRAQAAATAFSVHGAMALALIILLVLHVAAALKHHFIDRDGVLARMLPWLAAEQAVAASEERRPQRHNYVAAFLVLLISVILIGYAVTARLVQPEVAAPGTTTGQLQELVATSGTALPAWRVDGAESHIQFAGVHAGRPFTGRFDEWQAAIHIDTRAPSRSFIAAAVATASAADGIPMHDRSLPQAEWFDVARHPHATYRSTAIEARGDGSYALSGILTIKGNSLELAPLTLRINGDSLSISGTLAIDRADVAMGMESDPNGQHVSRTVEIQVEIIAVVP
ncbi:MAG: cytochrome b/b6 domain-containing protein [Porticoccaceae bacterium]